MPNELASRLDPPALERNRRELYGSRQNTKSGKGMAKGKLRMISFLEGCVLRAALDGEISAILIDEWSHLEVSNRQ